MSLKRKLRLGGMVERLWNFAVRPFHKDKPLSPDDVKVFQQANNVCHELDGYHGRALFDDRNIEDILSILSFNVMGGDRKSQQKLDAIIRALSRTIELSCDVTHTGVIANSISAISTGPDTYRSFWRELFSYYAKRKQLPSIISFNYDLVLERSLLQVLNNTYYGAYKDRVPFSSFQVRYFSNSVPDPKFKIAEVQYRNRNSFETTHGTALREDSSLSSDSELSVEILKLHGSLNFPSKLEKTSSPIFNIAECVSDPFILPPIFNKSFSKNVSSIWQMALQRLRETKNLTIVGYSLPKTDIYMQYFLKAALGPNLDLNRITVFDPVLFENNASAKDMEDRYATCFSEQLRTRIVFRPKLAVGTQIKPGTLNHFVYMLGHEPDLILF